MSPFIWGCLGKGSIFVHRVHKNILAEYFSAVEKERLYSSAGNLRFRLKSLFEGIDFKDKRILDIGGGSGVLSFYAGCRGAKYVVCLEPEVDGSAPYVLEKFRRFKSLLSLNHVFLETSNIQKYEPVDIRFDIVLLHNSVNHLNEEACIRLMEDKKSREIYRNIFRKIALLAQTDATLIISDCSRYNFFNQCKMKNFFARHIEWHKHQAPEVWVQLLEEVGFGKANIEWMSLDQMRSLGLLLFGNKVGSYFLGTNFLLTMKKMV